MFEVQKCGDQGAIRAKIFWEVAFLVKMGAERAARSKLNSRKTTTQAGARPRTAGRC